MKKPIKNNIKYPKEIKKLKGDFISIKPVGHFEGSSPNQI